MADVTLTIDGKEVSVPEGTTILKAAQIAGQVIPTICYHDHCTPNAVCRTCMVEVEGWRVLAASCVAEATPGMVVHTHSQRVERSRRTILEMLGSAVDLSEAPEIQHMLAESDADPSRFPAAHTRQPPL